MGPESFLPSLGREPRIALVSGGQWYTFALDVWLWMVCGACVASSDLKNSEVGLHLDLAEELSAIVSEPSRE